MDTDDLQLIEAYQEGDTQAFEQLVVRYTDQIYAFVARLSGDPEEAHDITQDAFVRAWSRLHTFDQSKSFKTWLYTIARNATIDWLRKRRNIQFAAMADPEAYEESVPDTEPLPDALFAARELSEFVEAALGEISPTHREVILLHLHEGLTFREVAEVTGQPDNTVKSQYRRALLALREHLLPHAPK